MLWHFSNDDDDDDDDDDENDDPIGLQGTIGMLLRAFEVALTMITETEKP